MATKFVTSDNLAQFKENLDNTFVAKEEGKSLSSNDYTTEEKEKLAGLSNYTLPKASAETAGGIKVGEGLAIDEDGVLSASVAELSWENVKDKPEILTTADVTTATNSAIAAAHLVSTSDLEDYITSDDLQEVSSKLTGVYRFKGSVVSYEELPTEDVEIGDVYNVISDGMNYAKVEGDWDALGSTIDLTDYLTKSDLVVMSDAEVDALFGIVAEPNTGEE